MFAPYSHQREFLVAPTVKVLLSNLINNGVPFGKSTMDPSNHGVKCIVDNFNIDYNSEVGFFDGNNKFYPKVYSVNLNLKVFPSFILGGQARTLILGFDSDGEYSTKDIKSWPFNMIVNTGGGGGTAAAAIGTPLGSQVEHIPGGSNYGVSNRSIPSVVGFTNGTTYVKNHEVLASYSREESPSGKLGYGNYSQEVYSQEHDALISFYNLATDENEIKRISFPSFISNFSEQNAFEFSETSIGHSRLFTSDSVKDSGFQFTLNVLADSLQQSILNLAKIQVLMRHFAPQQWAVPPGKTAYVKFNRLLQEESVALNSMSIKIDTQMGFFDNEGKLFPKAITLDLKLSRTNVTGVSPEGRLEIIVPTIPNMKVEPTTKPPGGTPILPGTGKRGSLGGRS